MAEGQIKQKQATISKSSFEEMCNIQCTKEEICTILNVSDTTLTRWCKETYGDNFEGVYKKYSSGGKMSLRRTMFKQAEKNPTIAIWLSKQHLGMKDNVEVEHDAKNGILGELIGALNKAKGNNNE